MKKNANLLNKSANGNYALFAKIPYGGAYEGFEEFGQFGDDTTWAFWLNWTGDNSSCIFWMRFDVADIRKGDKKIRLVEYNTWSGTEPLVFYKDNTEEQVIELYARNKSGRPGVVQLLSQSYNRNIIMIDRLSQNVDEGELTPGQVLNVAQIQSNVVKEFTGDKRQMGPNGIESWDIDVTKSGYTPIAITGIAFKSNKIVVGGYSTQGNHAYLNATNPSTDLVNDVEPQIFVLYQMDPVW